jgi:hypothetical protein
MGAGVVACDSIGGVLAMHYITKDSITSPTVVETVGAWTAVELALRLDLRRVIFDGDALEIIQALAKEGDCWAIYGQTLNAIKMELARQHGWLFQHVSRVANSAAHRLARLAFVYGEDKVFICLEMVLKIFNLGFDLMIHFAFFFFLNGQLLC